MKIIYAIQPSLANVTILAWPFFFSCFRAIFEDCQCQSTLVTVPLLKQNCLHYCQTPIDFIHSKWKEGRAGAFKMISIISLMVNSFLTDKIFPAMLMVGDESKVRPPVNFKVSLINFLLPAALLVGRVFIYQFVP